MDHGSVYRRCGCQDEATGTLLRACCPGLSSPEHGSWYFSADLPSAAGQRRRVRRGGFATRAAAAAALEALGSPAAGPEPGLSTGEWLGRWLASRVSLRASTARSYGAHIRGYLVPYLGGIPLTDLTAGDVQDADGIGAAAAARRAAGPRAAEERRRVAGHRAGQDHHRRAARAQGTTAGRRGRLGEAGYVFTTLTGRSVRPD